MHSRSVFKSKAKLQRHTINTISLTHTQVRFAPVDQPEGKALLQLIPAPDKAGPSGPPGMPPSLAGLKDRQAALLQVRFTSVGGSECTFECLFVYVCLPGMPPLLLD